MVQIRPSSVTISTVDKTACTQVQIQPGDGRTDLKTLFAATRFYKDEKDSYVNGMLDDISEETGSGSTYGRGVVSRMQQCWWQGSTSHHGLCELRSSSRHGTQCAKCATLNDNNASSTEGFMLSNNMVPKYLPKITTK